MRKIVAGLLVSLGGVVESPERWVFPYLSDDVGKVVGSNMESSDEMLLGRTYEEWVLSLLIFPTVAGSGRRLFEDPSGHVPPKLLESRTFDNGSLFLIRARPHVRRVVDQSGMPTIIGEKGGHRAEDQATPLVR
jgi:hypothetical protein